MTSPTPERPGVIQVRLNHLRDRKAVLDELIRSLEKYAVYQMPLARALRSSAPKDNLERQLAGAA